MSHRRLRKDGKLLSEARNWTLVLYAASEPMPTIARALEASVANSPVQCVLSARARLGESPVWDAAQQRLYWVDAYNHWVNEFDPANGSNRRFDVGDVAPAIALTRDQRLLLLALRDSLALLSLDTGDIQLLEQMSFADPGMRFNEGKCDPQGRFWIGSISVQPGQAALYRYDGEGSLRAMETGLTISNGLAWSPDGGTFYLTDSAPRRIYAYHFDGKTGSIGNRRVLIDLSGEVAEPDGLTVDRNGDLWSALWNGWCVVHFDASGRELERIRLPVQRPTSLAFGGPDLTDLYVTSASVGLDQTEIQRGFTAGDLYRLPGRSRGLAVRRLRSEALGLPGERMQAS
jgi:sugar lactone lactonase YvrE